MTAPSLLLIHGVREVWALVLVNTRSRGWCGVLREYGDPATASAEHEAEEDKEEDRDADG